MAPTSAEKILENFPHPTIEPIIGKPTFETLAPAHLKLNTNAASVYSHRGNGQLGYLYLTVKEAVLAILSSTPFTPPTNPGQHPVIPAGSTGPQIADIRRQHEEAFEEFKTYSNTDKALKSQLIAAVDEKFIRGLRNKYVGYANVTTLQLLNYLYENYAKITHNNLRENDQRMNAPYDPNEPIEVLIDQIEDGIDYAAAGNMPCTPTQIVNTAHNLLFDAGVFADECKEWRKRPATEQTWDNLKTAFIQAHQDLQESNATAGSTGYANNVTEKETEVLEAMTHLANAATEDRNIIAKLTEQNGQLQQEVRNLQSKLVEVLEALAKVTPTANLGGGNKRTRKKYYCWTCGSNSNHPGRSCTRKKEGHQDNATEHNRMGGSTHRFN